MPTPSLELLTVFAAVAERGGFTAAAKALGVSKATVSKAVTELERQLGVSLFNRTTRRLSLTSAGSRAFERVGRILTEADALAEEAAETGQSPRGRLRLAAPLTFATRWLGPVLPEFLTAYPEVSLELTLSDRRIDLIGEGLDAALRISDLPDSSLTARQLAPVSQRVVAAPAYWARRGVPRIPQELSTHTCFRYANLPTAGVWRFFGPKGEDVRVQVSGPLCVDNGDVELPALIAGLGVAQLPDFYVHHAIAAGQLTPVLTDWRGPNLVLHLLSPPGRSQTRTLRALSDFLHLHFGGGRAPWLA